MVDYLRISDIGAYIYHGAVVLGNVTLSRNVSIFPGAVLRGDVGTITIGEGTNIQDNCTLHMEYGQNLVIGSNVSIGHNAVVHNSSIGDNVLIGMGAILLNNVTVGDNAMIGAGSLVTEGTKVGPGELWFGNPAKFRRNLTAEEIDGIRQNAEKYIRTSEAHKEGRYGCMK